MSIQVKPSGLPPQNLDTPKFYLLVVVNSESNLK